MEELAAASVFAYLLAYHRMPFALESLTGNLPPAPMLPLIVLIWLIIGDFMDALPAIMIRCWTRW